MKLFIRHTTHFAFSGDVQYGLQQLRKTPKSTANQSVVDWRTEVTGGKKEVGFEDHHNNVVELISIASQARELSILSAGVVDVTETHGVFGKHRGPAPLWLYQSPTARTEAKTGVRTLIKGLGSAPDLEALHALSERIREAITYEVGASSPDWSAEDAIAAGAGVCQDHSHVFLACARALDLPGRYVSGYLMLNDQAEQDAMHAWAEVHLSGLGWVGFDVSNGISPDPRYVRVATGLDYADAAPTSGLRVGGDGETLAVEIEVSQQQ